MGPRRAMRGALALAAACAAAGCTSLPERARGPLHFVGLYCQDRFEDLTEVADLGLTFTWKPGFALYASPLSLTPFGAGYFNGWFLGFGGGQFLGIGHSRFLVTRTYFAGGGLMMWGYEEFGWDTFDTEDLSTLQCQDVGAAAIVLPPHGRPGPVPSLRSYLHAGHFGFMANGNVYETFDFFLGIFGLDICGDDGVRLGKWPGMTYEEADLNAFEFTDYHRGIEQY